MSRLVMSPTPVSVLAIGVSCFLPSFGAASDDAVPESAAARERFSEVSTEALRISSDPPSWSKAFQLEFQVTDSNRKDGLATTRYVLESDGRQSGLLEMSSEGIPLAYYRQGQVLLIPARGKPGWVFAPGAGFRFDCVQIIDDIANIPKLSVTVDPKNSSVTADLGGFLAYMMDPGKPVVWKCPFGERIVLINRATGSRTFVELVSPNSIAEFPIRRVSATGKEGNVLAFCRIKSGYLSRSILRIGPESYATLMKRYADRIRAIPQNEIVPTMSFPRIRGEELTSAEREVGLDLLRLLPIHELARAKPEATGELRRQVVRWRDGERVNLSELNQARSLLRVIAFPQSLPPLPERWAPDFDPSDPYHLVECNCGPVTTAALFAKLEATIVDSSAALPVRAAALATVRDIGLPVGSRLIESARAASSAEGAVPPQLACSLASVQCRYAIPDEACIAILRKGFVDPQLSVEDRAECLVSLGLLGRAEFGEKVVADLLSSAGNDAAGKRGPTRLEIGRALASNWSGQSVLLRLLKSPGKPELNADLWTALSGYVEPRSPVWAELVGPAAATFQDEAAPAAARAAALLVLSRDKAKDGTSDQRIAIALRSEAPPLRIAAFHEIARTSAADRFLPAIGAGLRSPDFGVRAAAGSALVLQWHPEHSNPITPDALDLLAQMLAHDDPFMHREAVAGIGSLVRRRASVPQSFITTLVAYALAAKSAAELDRHLATLEFLYPGRLKLDAPQRNDGAIGGVSLVWLAKNRKHALSRLKELAAELQIPTEAYLDKFEASGFRGSSKPFRNSIGMELVSIPEGEFEMGEPERAEAMAELYSEESWKRIGEKTFRSLMASGRPVHRVRITKAFYLGRTEVTKGQFRTFANATDYRTDAEKDGKGGWGWTGPKDNKVQPRPEFNWRHWGVDQSEESPVVNVTWNDAVAFCEWLSGKEQKTYRLPTEAEWEYACRAGTKTRYYCGQDPEGLTAVGNVRDAKAKEQRNWLTDTRKTSDGWAFTCPAGRFKPNAFGLYDMHGNAAEWCSDWYHWDYYKDSPTDDPTGASSTGLRVTRGGSWSCDAFWCCSARRTPFPPMRRDAALGFRVVCEQ